MQGGGAEDYEINLVVRAQEQLSGPFGRVSQTLGGADREAKGFAATLRDMAAQIGTTMLIVGAATAGMIAFGLHSEIAFQTAITHVKAFAATTPAARAEVDAMSAKILDVAPKLGLSATSMAQGLYAIESASITGARASEALSAASNAAAASQTDLSITTDALTTVINAYGLQAGHIKQAQDEMTLAVLRGKMEFRDFAASLGNVVPVAANLHVSIGALGAGYAVLTNQGNSAAESSIILRNILQSLSAPTLNQTRTAEALGLGIHGLDVAHQGLGRTLHSIADAIHNQGIPTWEEYQKATGTSEAYAIRHTAAMINTNTVLRALFGGNTTTIRGFLSLMSGGGQQFDSILKEMGNASTAADAAMREAFTSTQHQMDQLRAGAEVVGIRFGQVLLPAFNNVLAALIPMMQGLAQFAQDHPHVVEFALLAGTSIGLLGIAIRGVQFTISPVLGLFQSLGQGFLLIRARAIESAVAQAAVGAGAGAAAAGTAAEGAAAAETTPLLLAMNTQLTAMAALLSAQATEWGIDAAGVVEYAAAMSGAQAVMVETTGLLAAVDAELVVMEAEEAAAAVGMWALGGAMIAALGPVGLIAVAVAGVGTAAVIAYQKWPPFHKAVNDSANSLQDKFTGAVIIARKALEELDDKIHDVTSHLGPFQGAADAAAKHGNDFWDAVGGFTHDVGQDAITRMVTLGTVNRQYADIIGSTLDAVTKNAKAQEENAKATVEARHAEEQFGLRMQARTSQETNLATAIRVRAQIQHTADVQAQIDVAALIAKQNEYAASIKAMSYRQDAGSAGGQLQQAASTLPAEFKSAFQPVIDDFAKSMDTETQKYLAGLRSANTSYDRQIAVANSDFLAKYRAADDVHRIALRQEFDKHIQSLKDAHQQMIDRLQATYSDAAGKIRDAMRVAATPAGLWDALDKSVKNLADTSMKTLSLALLKGAGDTGSLAAAAAHAAERSAAMAAATDRATTEVNTRLGDFGAVVKATQAKLQTDLDNAVGKLTLDMLSHSGSVTDDQKAVDRAKAAMHEFVVANTDASGSTKRLKTGFDDLATAAQNRAKTALSDLAQAIYQGQGPRTITDLSYAAMQAATASQRYADAQTKAAAIVAISSHNLAMAFEAGKTAADAGLKKALDTAAEHIVMHGRMTAADVEAIREHSEKTVEYTKALAEAGKVVKKPETYQQREQGATTHADREMSKLAESFHNGSTRHQELIEAVIRARDVQSGYASAQVRATLAVAKATGDWVTVLDARRQELDTASKAATAKLVEAILHGHGNLEDLARSAAEAAGRQRTLAEAEAHAQILIAKASGDWVAVHQNAASKLQKAWDEATARVNEDLRQHSTNLAHDTALLQQVADRREAVSQRDAATAAIANQANINAARKAGDMATVFDLVSKQINDAMSTAVKNVSQSLMDTGTVSAPLRASLRDAADASEHLALVQRQTTQIVTEAQRDAAQRAGDLATAFTLTTGLVDGRVKDAMNALADHFLTGAGDLTQLLATYRQARAEQQANSDALMKAALATGDYTTAMNALKSQIDGAVSNALAGLTKHFLDGSGDLTSLLASYQTAKVAQDAYTEAQWKASYAVASLSERAQMLDQKFQGMINQATQQQSTESGIANANIAVLAAESAVAVGLLQAQVTATTDQTSVMQANASVQTASGAGQIAAINDATAVMQAVAAGQAKDLQNQQTIAADVKAGNLEKAAADRALAAADRAASDDAIRVAQLTARNSQADARAQLQIARDGLQTARDKATSDAANSAAQDRVLVAQLAVARASYQLTIDQAKLAADQLVVQNSINTHLAGEDEFYNRISGDLSNIGRDQGVMIAAQKAVEEAQSRAAEIQARGNEIAAQDAQRQAADQAAQAEAKQLGEAQLAEAKAQEARDTIAAQRAAAMVQAIQANTSAVNSGTNVQQQLLTAAQATLEANKQQLEVMTRAAFLGRIGLARTDVTGMDWQSWMNDLPGQSWANSATA